jgi:uncharacterized protein (DUF427 family)
MTQRTHSLDPTHVTVDANPVRIRVMAGNRPVAQTERGLVVREKGLPARYYIPREDVQMELLERTDQGASCPFKGDWVHLDLRLGDSTVANAAWTYYRTLEDGPQIRDCIAFYPEKVTLTVESQSPIARE